MHDINTFLPFWEGFSVVTIRPDGDAIQIDLIPHVTRSLPVAAAQNSVQPRLSIASELSGIYQFSGGRCASACYSGVLAVVTAVNVWRPSVGWTAMPA